MTDTVDWTWNIVVPEPWIDVDVDLPAADRRGALVAAVEEEVRGADELRDRAPWLVDVAHNVVSHAVDNDALFVAVGFESFGLEVVMAAVAGYSLDGSHPPDLAALADGLREPNERDVGERDVQLVELPVGPAVRVHVISADGLPDEDGKVGYVESVDHFIPVPGGTDMLLVTCTTPSIAVGELAVELFDEITKTVEIAPV